MLKYLIIVTIISNSSEKPTWSKFNFNIKKYLSLYETNGDGKLHTNELLSRNGYENEVHYVTTEDNYILQMQRILPKGNAFGDNPPIILFCHGLGRSSVDFLVLGPNDSLAYQLSDIGYDVWFLNCRGNLYSTNHTTWKPFNPFDGMQKYWDFSFHEMGYYDLPAAIDYILNLTKQVEILHLGHSLGSAIFFVMLSERPEYNKKIKVHVAWAPGVFVNHCTEPLLLLLAYPEGLGIESFLVNLLQLGFVPPCGSNCPTVDPFYQMCALMNSQVETCPSLTSMLFKSDETQYNNSLNEIILGHIAEGTSMRAMLQYTQNIVSKTFSKYRNKPMQEPLEEYNLNNALVPVYAFSGLKDTIQHPEDTKMLGEVLPNGFVEFYTYPNMGHSDFAIGRDAIQDVYPKVLKIFKSYACVSN